MSLTPGRAARVALLVAALTGASPPPASAQLSDPCAVACGVVLGAASFTVATGALVARARVTGGIASINEAALVWGTGLAATAGAGIALGRDGERQERAVYAAGLGALAGAALGVGLRAALGASTSEQKLAAALLGAAAGVLIGGAYGALSHETSGGGPSGPLVQLRLSL